MTFRGVVARVGERVDEASVLDALASVLARSRRTDASEQAIRSYLAALMHEGCWVPLGASVPTALADFRLALADFSRVRERERECGAAAADGPVTLARLEVGEAFAQRGALRAQWRAELAVR